MKSTNSQAEISRNSLCRDVGHDWKTTTASNYRLCQRDQCRAAQRVQDGQWVNIPPKRALQRHATSQQSSLF